MAARIKRAVPRTSLLVGAGAAFAAFLAVAGIAVMALPLQCSFGDAGYRPCLSGVAALFQPQATVSSLAPQAAAAVPDSAEPTALPAEADLAVVPPAAEPEAVVTASTAGADVPPAAATEPGAALEPMVRVVKAIRVDPDFEPLPTELATAPAGTEQAPVNIVEVAALPPAALPEAEPAATELPETDVAALPQDDFPEPPVPLPRPADLEVAAVDAEASGDTATVGRSGVNVRSGPSMQRGKVFTLTSGKEVVIIGEEDGWLHIRDAEGRTGWAYSDFFTGV